MAVGTCREKGSTASHYQPLADLLQLTPHSLDVIWERALITEGVTDKNVLELMFRLVGGKPQDFTIYPGTGAFNLETLISLNIGWASDFRVLLDSDDDGRDAQGRYIEHFDLDDTVVVTLPQKNSKD